jgi:hypothetical protein
VRLVLLISRSSWRREIVRTRLLGALSVRPDRGGIMTIKKTLVAMLAMAIAIAFSPLPQLQAATLGPNSQPGSENSIEFVQAKKKAKKGKKKKGKKKKAKKAGKSCGTYMYRKGGKCLDARNKK